MSAALDPVDPVSTDDAPPAKKPCTRVPSGVVEWPIVRTLYTLAVEDGELIERLSILARSERGEDGYTWWYNATEETYVTDDDVELMVWEVKCVFRDGARAALFAHIREHVVASSVPPEEEWDMCEHRTPGYSAQTIYFHRDE